MIVLQQGWWALTAAEVVINTDLESSEQVTNWSFRLVTMNTVH